ncbi:hypothetical protein ACR1PO_15380 [Chryseobacterium sp. RRHN12]|uniref:hypothetical protein n=1 Tax=Chryseobacterium sp. RRHN12 TaxID=3437884 RepID=UPI003D9B2946
MKELIYSKIKEYDPQLKDFEISYSNHALLLDDMIMSYKGRNKLAKNKNIKELTSKVLINLSIVKEKLIQCIKLVVVRKDNVSRIFFFNEDFSEIFFDFTSPTENNSESN